MSFSNEDELQEAIHADPTLVQEGIPELDPKSVEDVARWVPLAREVRMDRGNADNLFLDINGIVTIVECKMYHNSELKRDVYAQLMSYAAQLRSKLHSFEGQDFVDEFFNVIEASKSESFDWNSFAEIIAELKKDDVLANANADVERWENEFKTRLRENIRRGNFRLIILSGESNTSAFPAENIQNLMQLMSYSEHNSLSYDLLLMDIRSQDETSKDAPEQPRTPSYKSQIIWRRYSPLPEVPIVAQSSRDHSEAIEKMRQTKDKIEQENPTAWNCLDSFLKHVKEGGFRLKEDTTGESIHRDGNSTYTRIKYDENELRWRLERHQIGPAESELFKRWERDDLRSHLRDNFGWSGEIEINESDSSKERRDRNLRITLTPSYTQPIDPKILFFLGKDVSLPSKE